MISRRTKFIIVALFFVYMSSTLAEHRASTFYLNNDPNAHVPYWNQPQNAGGFSMGCGPTSWAVVYGYWKQNRSKDRLFDGNAISILKGDPSSGTGGYAAPVVKATSEIANHVSVYYREN